MKRIFLLQALILLGIFCHAQNVGIGINNPAMPLHVSSLTDTALLLLENRAALATGTHADLYFKNGSYFTGAIKTIGAGNNTARLALFSYANANSRNFLRERLSILDNGNVGIGTTTPIEQLHLDSNMLIGLDRWTSVANDRLIRFGDGEFVSIGEAGADDRMQLKAARFHFTRNGGSATYIGINNPTPLYELDVTGSMRSTSNLIVGGFLSVTNNATVNGNATVAGNATVNGNTVLGGTIKIAGGSPGTGRVLTSVNNSGDALWLEGNPKVAFSAYLPNNLTYFNFGAELALINYTEEYDDGGAFNNANGTFSAPAGGLYQFDGNILAYCASGTSYRYSLRFYKNGVLENGYQQDFIFTFPGGGSSSDRYPIKVTKNIKLEFGDVVQLRITGAPIGGGSPTMGVWGGAGTVESTFSGVRLY